MDPIYLQIILGGFFSIVALIGTFVISRMYKKMDDLEKNNTETNDKIFKLGVNMHSKFVSKEEFYRLMDRIFEKLDKIDSKISDKEDKK